jgi:hypothetical protein
MYVLRKLAFPNEDITNLNLPFSPLICLAIQWLAKVFTPPWHFSYFDALQPGIKMHFLGVCII